MPANPEGNNLGMEAGDISFRDQDAMATRTHASGNPTVRGYPIEEQTSSTADRGVPNITVF